MSLCIPAQTNEDTIISRCGEASKLDVRLGGPSNKVLELIAEIKTYGHSKGYLGGGYFQEVRKFYKNKLDEIGDYYYDLKYYSVAIRYYSEARKYAFSQQKYQRKIDQCREALQIDKDKKEIPPGDCKKIVFLVEVSPGIRKHFSPIKKFVTSAYRKFLDIGKNDFHLIIYSHRAKLYPTNETGEIKQILTLISISTREFDFDRFNGCFPKHGLARVFDLVAEKFPQKVGIVFFISSGQDSRPDAAQLNDDLGRTIKSLKKNGFTVSCIFIDTGINKLERLERMVKIAEYAGTKPLLEINNQSNIYTYVNQLKERVDKIDFCSPVPREIHEVEKKEKEDLKTALEKTEKAKTEAEDKYKSSVKEKKIFFFVALSGLVLILGGFFLWKKLKPTPEEQIHLPILWGILDPQDEKFDNIDLYKESPGYVLDHPKSLPKLPKPEFSPGKRKGKKVITVELEAGKVEFLKKDKKSTRNHYIDEDTCYLKVISDEDENIFHQYKYIFLNKLAHDCENPVWKKEDFKCRDEIVKEIKDNFLDEINCHNCLIYGMGNSGKTSLMKHLYNIALGEDQEIKRQYSMAFIEFNHDDYSEFYHLEEEIKKQLDDGEEGHKKLILIDEFDKIFEVEDMNYCEAFGKFIRENSITQECFYIFSGKKGKILLKKDNCFNKLPKFIKFFNLGSLDNIEAIAHEEYEISFEFLESLLQDIGFPGDALSMDVRSKIISYSSGFPHLIKRILWELLHDWLAHYNKHPIGVDHVDKAVDRIKKEVEILLLERAYRFDERNYNGIKDIPAADVQIRQIMDILLKNFKGKRMIDKNLIQGDITSFPTNSDIEKERKKSFEEKIKQLKEMGFITESQDQQNLIVIPSLISK